MAVDIACSIVGKLAEYTVDPVLRQIKYLFFYKNNIQNLRNKVQELENKRNDVKLLVGAAERNTEIIGEEVSSWLLKVDNFKEKADEVLSSVEGSEMRCLFNRCPNLKSCYILSRRATKKTIEADELKVEGTFERVSYPRPSVQMLNLTSHRGFETRSSTKKKIKEALKDRDISIIGICGMPGVGKTTMAKEIINEVKDEKLFEEVAFAVVSNDLDINKIQDQLAEMLDLKIGEKTNKYARAGRLHGRLKGNNGKSILVVLDDVWEEIDLGTIGIPSPCGHEGLKIMFTTRNEGTCSNMGAQTFKVEVLSREEGWQLFKDMAKISDNETDELVNIAKNVAHECGGLPIALAVVGKALKSNKSTHNWRDGLRHLQRSSATNLEGMDNIVYRSIRLSYNYLVSNEERELLLLCSLFAEDESIPIENLVRYARGLELFKNTETLYETRDRAYSIVDNLKSCNLLQPGRKEDEVKLHDVIKDFCLQMAYEDERGYLVNHAGLKEWPEHDAEESRSAISITFDKLGQLPSGLKYQNVKLLRVICRDLGECDIPEEFFKDMKELRVLELKGMYIQIPSSIELLMGLRTLCLIDCKIHSQLPMIGRLKKLEILSFYHSSSDDYIPIELAILSNLRSLDLRFRKLSCPLRPGVLLGMKRLEELYLGDSIPREGEDQRYIIEELSSLTSLHTFEIFTRTPILMQILKKLCLEKLEKFQIIGTATPLPSDEDEDEDEDENEAEDQCFTRNLSLQCGTEASMLLQPEFLSLMKRTYYLHIEEAKVLKNLVSELDGDGFINLKTMSLLSGDFEYLIDATNSIPNGTFRKLESLELKDLPKLIEICNGNLPGVVIKPQLFCNLMTVKMHYCDTIRSLFRESVAKCLVNLQSLDIYSCPMLEEVVLADARENEVTKTCKRLEFPKLRNIDLSYLSGFKSFTSQSNSGIVRQTLFNQVNFPNMEELNVVRLGGIVKLLGKEMPITSLHKLKDMRVRACDELLTIAESDSIKSMQNLEDLFLWECNALEVLFDFEGIKVTTDDAEINMLGRLKTLYLRILPELVNITRMVPKGFCVFQNLTKLRVEGCKSLRYLFSPSIVNSLVALEYLFIQDCEAMEEIIGREEEENTSETRNIVMGANTPSTLHHFTQIVSMDAKRNEVINMLEFPKLNKLELFALSSLKSFRYESNNDGILRTLFNQVNFPNMEELNVVRLGGIVKLLGKETPITSLHKLKVMRVWFCDELLTIAESDLIQSLQNLEELYLWECNAPEVLFDFEGIKVSNDDAEINMLGRLKTLLLSILPELVNITRMVPKGICVFQNLTKLIVSDCKSLRYLFSPSIVSCLVALEYLSIENCQAFEEIIGREEEENNLETKNIVMGANTPSDLRHFTQVVSMDAKRNEVVDMTEFPKLRTLELRNLSSFKGFRFKSNNSGILRTLFNQVNFPNMEELHVEHLNCIVKLLGKEIHKLEVMEVRACDELLTIAESDSIQSLQNLEFLNVRECNALEVVFDIEGIKVTNDDVEINMLGRLRTLQLSILPELVSITRMVPKGICVLQNLAKLLVFDCKSLRYLFSPSIVNTLVALEYLSIENCKAFEEIIGREEEKENTSETRNIVMGANTPSNLHHFTQVVSMDAKRNEVIDITEFPKLRTLELRNLSSFKGFRSESNNNGILRSLFNQVHFPNMEELNVVRLGGIVKLLGKETPITSLHKLKVMRVWFCIGLLTIAESNSIKSLQNLEELYLGECNALEVLFDFEGIKVANDDAEINMLGRLKELRLCILPELVSITRMVPKGICVFQNLTGLTVEGCKSLRYLFSPSIVNSLVALEYLSIQDCEAMEEIIRRDEEEENTSETRNIFIGTNTPSNLHHFTQVVSMDAKRNEVIDMLEFPKLNKLELFDLSSFKSFRSESNYDGIHQTLFNQVTLPNMKELYISELQHVVMLVNTRVENSSKSLQNLEILEVKYCKALEVLFDLECLKIPEDHAESVFGRVRSLKLESLDKLVHIIGTVPKGIHVFESLTSIVVEGCGILKYIFSPSMAYSLVALNILEVSNCESIKAIVGEEEEGTSEIKIVEAMKTRIMFPKLDHLLLKNLSSIQMFCSHNCELVFPLLKDLTIENCPMMRKLSPWPVRAPKLDIFDLLDKTGGLAEEDQVCNK